MPSVDADTKRLNIDFLSNVSDGYLPRGGGLGSSTIFKNKNSQFFK